MSCDSRRMAFHTGHPSETAFLFGGVGAVAHGAARSLAATDPATIDEALERAPGATGARAWLLGEATGAPVPLDHLVSHAVLGAMHVAYLRRMHGIVPDAVIGMSLGEVSALFATGIWDDPVTHYAAMLRAGTFDRELAGEFLAVRRAWGDGSRFRNWRVLAPLDEVEAAARDEPRLHVTTVHTPRDMILGGEEAAGERVIARLSRARASRFPTELAVHCPEAASFAPVWHRLHDREPTRRSGVRFYSHADCAPVALKRAELADALTRQLIERVDFPRMIEQAWRDGVRTFIEVGPPSGCAGFVTRILRRRPHRAVALGLGAPEEALRLLAEVPDGAAMRAAAE